MVSLDSYGGIFYRNVKASGVEIPSELLNRIDEWAVENGVSEVDPAFYAKGLRFQCTGCGECVAWRWDVTRAVAAE